MKSFHYLNISAWVLVVIVSLFWNINNIKRQRLESAFQSARSFFDQIVITREWNAGHGGVYVQVTSRSQPNPYLKDADRDLQIRADLTLTKINPAFMTRESCRKLMRNSNGADEKSNSCRFCSAI